MKDSNKFAIISFLTAVAIYPCYYFDLTGAAICFVFASAVSAIACYDITRDDMRREFVDYTDDEWNEF